jgi:formylglycine-generating enzyme required for sulfatase activity
MSEDYIAAKRSFMLLACLCLCVCGKQHLSGDTGQVEMEDEVQLAEAEDRLEEEIPLETGCEEFDGGERVVCIPQGRFYMGFPPFDPSGEDSILWEIIEFDKMVKAGGGEHEVYLPAFAIDKYEVTIGEYFAYVSANPGAYVPPPLCENEPLLWSCEPPCDSRTGWGEDGKPLPDGTHGRLSYLDIPMNCINREEAEAYCRWRGGRLPTEEEWERAAKGLIPDRRKLPWGNDPIHGGPFDGEASCSDPRSYPLDEERLDECSLPIWESDIHLVEISQSPGGVWNLNHQVAEWVAGDFLPYPGHDPSLWHWSIDDCRVRGGCHATDGDPDTITYIPIWSRCVDDFILYDPEAPHYAYANFLKTQQRANIVGFRCAYDLP